MYLTSDMMTDIKRRGNIPTSQQTFQMADFYAIIDGELRSKLLPLILKDREEFYVRNLDYAITANQNLYMIPARAIAGTLRDVLVIPSSIPGAPTLQETDRAIPLERLDPSDLYASAGGSYRYNIQKSGFLIEGNYIRLYPAPMTTQSTLRLPYCIRPGVSVDPSACALISAINLGTNTVTVNQIPSAVSAGVICDLIRAQPGFEASAIDLAIASVSGSAPWTITFGSALPSTLSVGDYVCLASQSCVIQVPVELQPLLAQYSLVRVLEAQGDRDNLDRAKGELEKLEENAQLMIAPRVSGKPKRVVNTRGISRWV